jgi:hypothetical protein
MMPECPDHGIVRFPPLIRKTIQITPLLQEIPKMSGPYHMHVIGYAIITRQIQPTTIK